MKNPTNRARHNGGKTNAPAQSPNTTESAPEKPVAETEAASWLTSQAIRRILENDRTGFGLTAEIISEMLPQLGYKVVVDEVRLILLGMEGLGIVTNDGEFWKFSLPAPQLLNDAEIARNRAFEELEDASCQVGALLALMERVIVRPVDDSDWCGDRELGLTELVIHTHRRLTNAGAALSSQK